MKRLLIFLCVLALLVMPALADITRFYANTVDDGQLSRTGVIENFSDIRSGAGTQASTSAVTETSFLLTTGSSSEKWLAMRGFYWKASTAAIPDNAVIDSATMGFNSVSNCVSALGSFNITLSNFTEADTGTGLTTDDYNTLSGLVLSETKNTAQWNVDGYKNFTLNADGLSAINKTGNTTIALNFWRTLTNHAPAWSASKSSYCYVSDTSAGIAKAPFLEVTYHVGTSTPTPPKSITSLIDTTLTCSNVTFSWDNPPDSDYGELLVWRNNTALSNLTNTTTSLLWEGLPEGTAITFSAKTADLSGNVNTTWVNRTVTTASCGGSPVAGFSANRATGGTGAAITFIDDSTEGPTTFYWEFGDGNTSTLENPVHTYAFPGTFGVNHSATNGFGTDFENKTAYITIKNRPDDYLNPYTVMIPWLDQNSLPECSGAAGSYALMLMRYAALGTSVGGTQEPYARKVWYNWSNYSVKSDVHVDYVPSMASIYFNFPDTVYRLTDLGDILKTGANLETDKITSKSSATEYNYPQTREYLDSHRYNPIGNYVTETNNRTSGWEALKQNISKQHVVLLLIDTYSNLHDTPSLVMLPEPTGSPGIGHFVAAIGYNESLDQVYFLNSWGNNYTKIGGISKNYWMVSPKSKYLVPYNITIDEVLVPMGITNLNNSTANCTNISFSWNNPLHTDFSHTYTLKNNVWVGNYSNTTTSVLWEGLPEGTAITFSAKTADLSGNVNSTWVNKTVTTPLCGSSPVAGFSANNLTTCAGVPVAFTDESTNVPTGWYWEFGDGNTSTTQSPVHTYDVIGSKSVNLKATNEYGFSWKNKTGYLTVSNCLPTSPPTRFYADTVDDGRLSRAGVIESFSDIRSGAGNQASLTNVNESSFLLTTGSSSQTWITMRGFYWKASTAGIPDNAIIDSATMWFSSSGSCYSGLGSLNITLSNFTETDTGSGLTADDYNTLSGLVLSDTKTMTQWNVDGYKKFTLNADGLSAINKTGNTTIALNFWNTLTNTTPPWSASRSSYCYVYDTSNGTATRPYLNVTYHVDTATLAADFTASRTYGGYNAPIQFNDSSTGVIQSYTWSSGDGNQSTLQNPRFVYSSPGTYTVTLTVTNSSASDTRVKTNYIRIDTRPDTYVNPYHVMIPWLQQGSQSWCAAFAASNAFMIRRYTALGVPPAATQEPYTRNVLYSVSGVPVYSDRHVDYTPSAASIYWTFDNLSMGDHDNVTALAETMKRGYNLQTDKITPKSGSPLNYYYPMGTAYETSHRYNPITRYTIKRGGTQSSWDSLKRNISDNGVVVLMLDYYSNGNNTSTKVIIDGQTAIKMAEPIGTATNAHALAAIGYNSTEDLVYVLNTWGEVRAGGIPWTKLGAISKNYWMYGTRSAFIVPKSITINEVLVPMGITNLTNSTANCTNISFSWNNPLHTDFNHTYTLKNNVWAGNYSKTTTSVVWKGLPESTEYTFSARTCDREGHCNTTWINKTVTTATCGLQAVAAFSANNLTTCAGVPVAFTDESTNNPTGWYWEFGDGNTSTTRSPVHTYNVIGSMSVNLKAMNEYGFSWKNKTGYLTVSDCSPPPSPARFYANTVDDGQLSRTGVTESFSDIRSGAGTQASTSGVTETSFLLTTGSSSETWQAMRGFYWKASTAAIPDNAIIDSATVGFNSVSNCVTTLGSFNITLSNFTGADTGTGLTTDDYNTLSGLALSESKSITTWNVDGYKYFTLNADGLSAINKTGNTTFALNFWRTVTNNAPTWSASKSSYCYVYDTSAGIAKAPFLEVTYH